MTASLPPDVQAVFERFITTEFTTIDPHGQPITWPLVPYYKPGGTRIDVTTGLGYPKKAKDARANPLVSMLFSDPTGSGLSEPPTVLVQGSAEVDDADLEANRKRYKREFTERFPDTAKLSPPEAVQKLMQWYFTRIYIRVRPERVYVWPRGEMRAEPALYDTHMEEVRSGHSEEPDRFHAPPEGGASVWDERIEELGTRYRTAVLSIVSPDGFPFSIRAPIAVDRAGRRIRIEADPGSVPLQSGLACLTAHEHAERFTWQQNFQLRGDLTRAEDQWVLMPHKLVGGFELPKSRLELLRANAAKARRFHRVAKRELASRS